jgi:hypothetical protein
MLNCMYKLFANYLLKETVGVYADFLLLRFQKLTFLGVSTLQYLSVSIRC